MPHWNRLERRKRRPVGRKGKAAIRIQKIGAHQKESTLAGPECRVSIFRLVLADAGECGLEGH